MAYEQYALTFFFGIISCLFICIYSVLDNQATDELLTEEEIKEILNKRRHDTTNS
jgi:hypothetical protein